MSTRKLDRGQHREFPQYKGPSVVEVDIRTLLLSLNRAKASPDLETNLASRIQNEPPSVANMLAGLPRATAPQNFEEDLFVRIQSGQRRTRKWLAGGSLAVVVIILLTIGFGRLFDNSPAVVRTLDNPEATSKTVAQSSAPSALTSYTGFVASFLVYGASDVINTEASATEARIASAKSSGGAKSIARPKYRHRAIAGRPNN